jgi:calcineurin-like phosphoesterase family protein
MANFFTSDYHFGHRNIIKYSNRPFRSSEEMDEVMIDNTNKVVGAEDTLYFLGDWTLPGRQYNFTDAAKRYRDRINCNHIVFIWGNHDKKGRGNHNFTRLFKHCADIIDHEITDPDTKMNQRIVMMHYAMRVWDKSHRGTWMLYGHSHNSLPDDPNALSFDVGVDGAAAYFGNGVLKPENYRPMSFTEVKGRMATKTYKPIDHHGQRDHEM